MAVRSAFVRANGVRTHYLEAGDGPPVVLLHGGEYGGCAELSWRYSIAELATCFRVYAPDLVGYGETEKIHHFTEPSEFRIGHIAAFCEALCIDRAHFVGNSYGASLLLRVASSDATAWPIDRIIAVSGGGAIPVNDAREVLLSYDGSREHMRRILQVLFYDERWWEDDMVDAWHASSLRPGAWEALSAARLARPGKSARWRGEAHTNDVAAPTLIVAGREDLLREPGYAPRLAAALPRASAVVFERARHCPHIEHAGRFNELALKFLTGEDPRPSLETWAAEGVA